VTLKVSQTTPATRWITVSSFPHDFEAAGNNRFPKALFVNEADQTIVVEDQDGTVGSFVLANGVPIQIRPRAIVSFTGATVIALFD